MADDSIDHLGELEKRLYARDPENVPKRTFGILRPERQTVTSTWGQTTVPKTAIVPKRGASGYRRFFIFSLVFFLLALGGAAYSMYRGVSTLSSKNVDISILGNSFVAAGDTLPLQVEVMNSNSAALLDAKIALDYPKGANDGSGSDTAHVEQNVGTVNAGQTKSQAFSVVLYGQQGTAQTITATFSYQLKNSSAVFQKTKTFSVMISSSPLTLTVDGPTTIAANQSFELSLNNSFTSSTPLSNVITRVEYPSGFVFASADPAPTGGNNVWALGDLESGTNRAIVIRGKLTGQENEQKSFRIYVGTPASATDTSIATVYNSALQTITLANPFIDAQINVNGIKTDVIPVSVGDTSQGTISWANTSATTISNPTFTLSLQGAGIDPDSVTAANGYFDRDTQTITWDSNSASDLASLAPGQTGTLSFSFASKANDTNDVGLHLSVQGTFPENNYQQQNINDIDVKTVRYSAHLQFAAQSFYSVGPFKNTGPYPAKANQTTTYTLTWTARPSENPLTNMVASAVLPPGVTWAGVISPQSEPVNYSVDSRTVTWNVGVMPQATSTPKARTVSFQVSVKPTKDQVGQEVPLLGETTVTATDGTANVPLTVTRPALTTTLSSDPVYSQGKERVLP